MDDNQVKVDKTLKETLAKMEAERKADAENLKSIMERMMDTDQTDVKLKELTEMVETTHRECEEPTSADMKACQETTVSHEATEADEETMACQEETEACLQGEPASEDMTPEVAHEQEFPLEDAVIMPVGEPRKRRQDRRHLATQRRQKKEEERTQRKDGCRKNLVAARCAAVA
jgi:hypothetical protein